MNPRAPHSALQSPLGWVPSPKVRDECISIMAYADPLNTTGPRRLTGPQAVDFLSRSGLSKEELRNIWLIADYNKQGWLGVDEFCVACRLISMKQSGKPATRDALRTFSWIVLPAPRFTGINDNNVTAPSGVQPSQPTQHMQSGSGGLMSLNTGSSFTSQQHHPQHQHASQQLIQSGGGGLMSFNTGSSFTSQQQQQPQQQQQHGWTFDGTAHARYEKIFFTADLDENGQMPPMDAVRLLTSANLDKPTLKRVWDLAKTDTLSPGLDSDEFCSAMALVEGVSKRGLALPATLPAELVPGGASTLSAAAKIPGMTAISQQQQPTQMIPGVTLNVGGGGGGMGSSSIHAIDSINNLTTVAAPVAPREAPKPTLSASEQAAAMLAEIDAEENSKAEAIAQAARSKREAQEAQQQQQTMQELSNKARNAAELHRRTLIELQHEWSNVVDAQHVAAVVVEQTNRVNKAVEWSERMLARGREERAQLKVEAETAKHQAAQAEADYQTLREHLVASDTALQSLKFQREELVGSQ